MKLSTLRVRRAWLRMRRVVKGGERGATAVVVALSLVLLMAAGAFGFDVAKLYYERQQLRNAIDASAQAGASALPTTATAQALAIQYANWNFPGLNLQSSDINFFCVVRNAAGTAAGGYPDATQVGVGRICEGKPGWTNADAKCNAASCAIPCNVGQSCNSIQIHKARTVDFVFGPAINIPTASTGVVQTLSCNGACGGTPPPNPMNVVVMADRTGSLSSSQLAGMRQGIATMLSTMNQDQQYVALGALAISATSSSTDGSTRMKPASTTANAFTDADYATFSGSPKKTTWSAGGKSWHFNGNWVPINFTNKYTKLQGGVVTMDTATQLGDAVAGLPSSTTAGYQPSPWHVTSATGDTLVNSSKWYQQNYDYYGQKVSTHGNTHLASALKAAARYVLNTNPASLGLPDAARTAAYGEAQKVIVFETDGYPQEIFNSASNALNLTNDLDIGATQETSVDQPVEQACENFRQVGQKAKDAGIIILTIAAGNAANSNTKCGTQTVAQMLAQVASPNTDGSPSDAPASGCDSAASRASENSDGDNFFCASDAAELGTVFTAAMGNLTTGTKFMSIPGVGD